MKKLKSILVENDPKSLSLLLSLISDYCPEIDVVSTATNIQDATKKILNQQPDLVFLDLELDDGFGFNMLHEIPGKKFKTIVTSGYSQYALDAFKFDVTHFLLKPVGIKDLRIAIDRVLHYDNGGRNQKETGGTREFSPFSQKKIQVPTNEGIKLINLNEIEFLEADGCYTIFHFINKTSMMTSKHLKSFESVLSGNNFYRIGRSYIINIDCIKLYNKQSGGKVSMGSGSSVVIPRRNKNEFLKYLSTYLENLK